MENKNNFDYENYSKGVIRWGRTTLLISIFLAFLPAIYLAVGHGLWPGLDMIKKAFIPIVAAWGILWLIEPISYYPILGLTGTYVSWLAGNILNLRLPCSILAQQIAGVKEGTKEGDIISTIGLSTSVVVNLIILVIFGIAGVQILEFLPNSLNEAFDYVLPAIFGAMMASYAFRNYKLAILALVIALIVKLAKVSSGLELMLIVFPTVIIALLLNKNANRIKNTCK